MNNMESKQPMEISRGETDPNGGNAGGRKLAQPIAIITLALAIVCALLALLTVKNFNDHRQREQLILDENARLSQELQVVQQQAGGLETELEQLSVQLREAEARTAAIQADIDAYAPFLTEASPSRSEYIENQMVELLDQRQKLVGDVRSYMTAGINNFLAQFSAQEFVPPEPIDVPKELLKDTISSLAGGLGSTTADVIGDTLIAGLDGEDMGTAALESIGENLTSAVQDQVLDALGLSDLANGVTLVLDAVSGVRGFLNTTPDYALSLTLNQALDHAQQVMEILNDPAADTNALNQAVYHYNYFVGYSNSAQNLRDGYELTAIWEAGLYDDLALVDSIDRALGIYAILLSEEGLK